jgi:probable rRNA maturation factor
MTEDPGSSRPSAGPAPLTVPVRTATRRTTPADVEIYVADEQDSVRVDTHRWMRLAAQVLTDEGIEGLHGGAVEMSLLFVDEAAITELNRQHMGGDGPTDVLSFPIDGVMAASSGRHPDNSPVGPTFDDDDEDDELPTMLGDVLICPAVAARHAPEHAGDHHDGSVEDELALLVVHGILHLIGHDHAEADEALRMREREVALLAAHHRGAVGSDTDVDGGEPAGDELDADIVDGTEP